ncbi:precorrin-3B synthase [Actinacidiphila guanduensis]|nr:precorrin-3B synthase [Actinacidiphila guanduensis]
MVKEQVVGPPHPPEGDACPGALRLHAADDGALARVRVPGGFVGAAQAAALGAAAQALGDGELHLTSRGNVQLRGLAPTCAAELERRLAAADLLPSRTHERVRNVVASPLTGLDGNGYADVRPWLRELDTLLCASKEAAALSGRFLFALDDGRGDVAALAPDITLRAIPDGGALLVLGRRAPLRISAAQAAPAALLAAETFLRAAAPTAAWRVKDLPDAGAALSTDLAHRLNAPTTEPPSQTAPPPPPGPIPTGPTTALCVLAPLGRLTPAQWHALTSLAERTPARELRLTPWRGVIVPSVPADRARAELAALAATGLATAADSPWLGVTACTGRPGCAKSHADVRADARATLPVAPAAPVTRAAPAGPATALLPVHWSGCARGCGRPRGGERVDVVAEPGGYRVDLVRQGRVHGSVRSGGPELAATVAAARRGALNG